MGAALIPAVRLLVIGASGHAKVVLDAAERSGAYALVGLLDDRKLAGGAWCGAPLLGATADLAKVAAEHSVDAFFVAIGDDAARASVVDRVRAMAPGLAWATIVHPSAVVARSASIGEGSVVMAGAVIQPDTRVAEGCIVNTRASIDHECVLGAYAAVSPGVALGGNVRLGPHAFVGIGASVIHGASIGAHAVVGAGAVVVHDVPDRAVAVGVPARVVRERTEGERYL